MKYRDIARRALDRATTVLQRDNDDELHYVALDLRMALEALIYEKALNYHKEMSEENLDIWQPKKLLKFLLEVDPHAEMSSTLSLAWEDESGKGKGEFNVLGKEQLVTLKEVKKYYHSISSYLHTKTIRQSEEEVSSPEEVKIKLKEKCKGLEKIIDKVLSSSVRNVNVRKTASLDCENCGCKIVQRIPAGNEKYVANCKHKDCSASYEISKVNERKVSWEPKYIKRPCKGETCTGEKLLWDRDNEVGKDWYCSVCNGHHKIAVGITYTPEPSG